MSGRVSRSVAIRKWLRAGGGVFFGAGASPQNSSGGISSEVVTARAPALPSSPQTSLFGRQQAPRDRVYARGSNRCRSQGTPGSGFTSENRTRNAEAVAGDEPRPRFVHGSQTRAPTPQRDASEVRLWLSTRYSVNNFATQHPQLYDRARVFHLYSAWVSQTWLFATRKLVPPAGGVAAVLAPLARILLSLDRGQCSAHASPRKPATEAPSGREPCQP